MKARQRHLTKKSAHIESEIDSVGYELITQPLKEDTKEATMLSDVWAFGGRKKLIHTANATPTSAQQLHPAGIGSSSLPTTLKGIKGQEIERESEGVGGSHVRVMLMLNLRD